MRNLVKSVAIVLAVASAFLFFYIGYTAKMIPDRFFVTDGEALSVNKYLTAPKLESGIVAASLDKSRKVTTHLRLFGLIPIKDVAVTEVDAFSVIPCGTPFGIKMFTMGVIVVGLSDVDSDGGALGPAKRAGIRVGDVIVRVDGQAVWGNNDVANLINAKGGNPVSIDLKRKGNALTVELTPAKSAQGTGYKSGMWVRDSSAGIGTMTFYNPADNTFAGLGHPICDIDTGEIMPLRGGEVVNVSINEVHPGTPGLPGELKGNFVSNETKGILVINCESGVYGKLLDNPSPYEPVKIALKQEIKTGFAKVYVTTAGASPQEFDIVIERVLLSDNSPGKNMIVKIADEKLLEKTGGIVQGMSGSPIIQNGKLVGAVTHVFVNDPTKGFAIFAENMWNISKGVDEMLEATA